MKLKGQSNGGGVIALAGAIEASAEAATVRVRLLPIGTHKTRDGRLTLSIKDAAAAQAVIAATLAMAGAQDIPVDYDHQTQFGAQPGVGGRAPAAAWIKPASLAYEDGPAGPGIYGDIEYTDAAAASVRAREYRYLSPVVRHDISGRIWRLDMVALTNFPALDGLDRLAASFQPQDPDMDLTALAASLGLRATATLDEITAAQQAQAVALSTAQADNTALRAALGVANGADQAAALSAATTLRAGATAQATTLASMQAQLATLTAASNEAEVDAAIAAGRVIPAQRDNYVAMMRTDPVSTRALMASNPVVVQPGPTVPGKPAAGDKVTTLSAEQKGVAAMLGVSEADYLKTLQENAQ